MKILGKLVFGTGFELRVAFAREGNDTAYNAIRYVGDSESVVFNLDYLSVKHTGEEAEEFWSRYAFEV